MKPNPIDVSKRIKLIRNNLGLTLQSFGDLIGHSPKSTVSTWESGRNLPNQTKLKEISEIGNVSVDWIKWGTLEDYINNYLKYLGYERYLEEFPTTPYEIFTEINEKYNKSFSMDRDYEYLNLIIKRIFDQKYSPIFKTYLNKILSIEIQEQVDIFSQNIHSISKERFISRFNSKFNDLIRNNKFKYGEKDFIISTAVEILEEMDKAYKVIEEFYSIDDFFFQKTKNEFETEKFLLDLSKKYNFPYEKGSAISKLLMYNHENFK